MDKKALFAALAIISACGGAYETDEPTQEELLSAGETGGTGGTGGGVGTGGGPSCPDGTQGNWVTIQNGLPHWSVGIYDNQYDTRISQQFPDTRYFGATFCGARGVEASGNANSCLVKWRVTGWVPFGKEVKEAWIEWYVLNASVDAYSVFATKRIWNHSGTTWNHAAQSTSLWQVPGAKGPDDREQIAFGTLQATAVGWRAVSVPVTLAQAWVTANDFAGVIIANPTSTDNVQLASGTHPTQAWRPRLSMRYCP